MSKIGTIENLTIERGNIKGVIQYESGFKEAAYEELDRRVDAIIRLLDPKIPTTISFMYTGQHELFGEELAYLEYLIKYRECKWYEFGKKRMYKDSMDFLYPVIFHKFLCYNKKKNEGIRWWD